MSDFKDLKAAFKATLSGVAGAAKEIAGSAGDKAKSVGRIAKLSMEINREKETAQSAYAEIGKLYYEMNRTDPGEFYVQLFDEVKLSNASIEVMETELAELKAEMGEGFMEPAAEDSFEEVVAQAEEEPEIEVEITVDPEDK